MGWMKSTTAQSSAETERRAQHRKPDRFFLKKGTKRVVVFLDAIDKGAGIFEHEWADWKNPLTCLDEGYEDVCCQKLGKKSRKTVYFFTVVDCEPFTDKAGKERQFEMKFFPMKHGTFETMEVKSEEEGGLLGKRWICRRFNGEKEARVGSEISPVSQDAIDLDELFDLTNYGGVALTKLWDEAEGDSRKMTELKKLFMLEFGPEDEDGKRPLLRKLVAFNYRVQLAPKGTSELTALLKDQTPHSNSKGSGGQKKKGSEWGSPSDTLTEGDAPF